VARGFHVVELIENGAATKPATGCNKNLVDLQQEVLF
jgi:hypothetical protein